MANQILKFYKKPKLKNGTLILGSIKGPLFKRKKSKKDNEFPIVERHIDKFKVPNSKITITN